MFKLKGDEACTLKVHLLKHYAGVVRKWGPLWVYGGFSFEGMNNQLCKFFHGTRNMSQEVSDLYNGQHNVSLIDGIIHCSNATSAILAKKQCHSNDSEDV